MIVAGHHISPKRFARFVERWLLKQRYIVEYPQQSDGSRHTVVKCSPAQLDKEVPGVELPGRLSRLADQRIECTDEFPLFVALDGDRRVMGYSFLFVPREDSWHDGLPVRVGEARETSSWVEEEFRGYGVRGSILADQMAYCAARGLRFTAVIEGSNRPSFRSSAKSGAWVRQRNLLIKVIGRNVMSVTTSPLRVYVLAGTRRSHR